ncbi:MAG: putative metal-binding motif-containing protein [Alphaproteobacteria bacterium]|nr:putative metal-binding motif-containing protein [Alphaproteobacteria bacterium]
MRYRSSTGGRVLWTLALAGCAWIDERAFRDVLACAEDPSCGETDTDVPELCYVDLDGDNFGGEASGHVVPCPDDTIAIPGDCDDTRPEVHPGAPELCNGEDDDCSGSADETGVVSIGAQTFGGDLEAAIEAGGGPIHVCAGSYVGPFVLASDVDIIGFADPILGRPVLGPVLVTAAALDVHLESLILDGRGVHRSLDSTSPGLALVDVDLVNGSGTYGAGAWLRSLSVTTMEGGAVRGNVASEDGGGIHANNAWLTIDGTVFEGNVAGGAGGGLSVDSDQGVVAIEDAAFVGNVAERGGGIQYNRAGLLQLARTELVANEAPDGAAIAVIRGNSRIEACTIHENVGGEALLFDQAGAEHTLVGGTVYGHPVGAQVRQGVFRSEATVDWSGTPDNEDDVTAFLGGLARYDVEDELASCGAFVCNTIVGCVCAN